WVASKVTFGAKKSGQTFVANVAPRAPFDRICFSTTAAVGQLEHRSRISTDLKDFLPGFLIPRELSDIVDGQHVRRRRPDFFQRFHFGMSRSFTCLSINLLSFFTDDPANPE